MWFLHLLPTANPSPSLGNKPSEVCAAQLGGGEGGSGGMEVAGGGLSGCGSVLPVSAALMAQQLPPLTKFSGEEQGAGETFNDWVEQFKMVASVCRWDESTQLVNLVTRLKGQAFAFYRSCDLSERTSYSALVEELRKSFTPVHIQSVQSSLFHEHKQRPDESMDAYAQDLKVLFFKAYPKAQQSHTEVESMGRSVLAYQFVAGLLPDLKVKLTGVEGGFEQLLVKARFEEAKARDLCASSAAKAHTKKPAVDPLQQSATVRPESRSRVTQPNVRGKCFNCGKPGHIARHCQERRRGGEEASGKHKVAVIDATGNSGQERVASLRKQLREAELKQAVGNHCHPPRDQHWRARSCRA